MTDDKRMTAADVAMKVSDFYWSHMEKEGIQRESIPYKGWPEIDSEKLIQQFADQAVEAERGRRNAAYSERNKCVVGLMLLARELGYTVGRALHPENDTHWETDWRNIAVIELPTGQVTWHFHDSEARLIEGFDLLEDYNWDGHTTDEKYRRVLNLPINKTPRITKLEAENDALKSQWCTMTDDKRMTAADVKKQVNTWIKKHDLPIDSSAKVDLYELLKMAVEAERERWNADLIDLHWMARRYADGRQSYATSLFNDIARRLIAAGIKLNQCDGTPFARDAMGRGFDGLTDEEAATAKDDWWSKPANGEELNQRITELEAERDALKSQVAACVDALTWTSGSADFNEGGAAYEGFKKCVAPLIYGDLDAEARARDERLIEKLAEIEHDQWVHWAKSILETETISTARAERWKGLFVPYSDLTEEQKEQDRVWARKVLQAEQETTDERLRQEGRAEACQWQPIETADTGDKTRQQILLFNAANGATWLGYWNGVKQGWFIYGTNSSVTPSHWMPLPEPPQAEREGD